MQPIYYLPCGDSWGRCGSVLRGGGGGGGGVCEGGAGGRGPVRDGGGGGAILDVDAARAGTGGGLTSFFTASIPPCRSIKS